MTNRSDRIPAVDHGCKLYTPGHQVHWIQARKSWARDTFVLPVRSFVGNDGVVITEFDGSRLEHRNHEPARLAAALDTSVGYAEWRPQWHVLAVPNERGYYLFCLAAPDQWSDCVRRDLADG
ncbi:MAG: hypothetical protein WAW17_26100 [Rhodococcus sp. (in: high G+C Gram-positive bacteria)]|uniref:hypothetical protein n=1 Tax=Rhodococcus sp. TaxID=1831 RepID=UPI003BAEE777